MVNPLRRNLYRGVGYLFGFSNAGGLGGGGHGDGSGYGNETGDGSTSYHSIGGSHIDGNGRGLRLKEFQW